MCVCLACLTLFILYLAHLYLEWVLHFKEREDRGVMMLQKSKFSTQLPRLSYA